MGGTVGKPSVKDTGEAVLAVLIQVQERDHFELVPDRRELFDKKLHLVLDPDSFPNSHQPQHSLVREGVPVQDAN